MFTVRPRRLSDTPRQLLGQNTLPRSFVPLIFAVAIQADTSEAKEHHWAPESTRRVATAWAWRGECTAFTSLLSRRRSPSTAALGSPRSSVPRGTVSPPCGTVRPHPRSGGYLLPQAEPEFEVAQPLAKAGPLFCVPGARSGMKQSTVRHHRSSAGEISPKNSHDRATSTRGIATVTGRRGRSIPFRTTIAAGEIVRAPPGRFSR